jgi:hypothetical protein
MAVVGVDETGLGIRPMGEPLVRPARAVHARVWLLASVMRTVWEWKGDVQQFEAASPDDMATIFCSVLFSRCVDFDDKKLVLFYSAVLGRRRGWMRWKVFGLSHP